LYSFVYTCIGNYWNFGWIVSIMSVNINKIVRYWCHNKHVFPKMNNLWSIFPLISRFTIDAQRNRYFFDLNTHNIVDTTLLSNLAGKRMDTHLTDVEEILESSQSFCSAKLIACSANVFGNTSRIADITILLSFKSGFS